MFPPFQAHQAFQTFPPPAQEAQQPKFERSPGRGRDDREDPWAEGASRIPGGDVAPPPSMGGVQIAPPPDLEVHEGITCGRCHMSPIRGDRFKCSVCDSFDLCETCYDYKAQVHPSHRFFVQKAVKRAEPAGSEATQAAPAAAETAPSLPTLPVPVAGSGMLLPPVGGATEPQAGIATMGVAATMPPGLMAHASQGMASAAAAAAAAMLEEEMRRQFGGALLPQAPQQGQQPFPQQMQPTLPQQIHQQMPQQVQQQVPQLPQQMQQQPFQHMQPQLQPQLQPQQNPHQEAAAAAAQAPAASMPPLLQPAVAPQQAQVAPTPEPEPAAHRVPEVAAAAPPEEAAVAPAATLSLTGPGWLPPELPCSLCHSTSDVDVPHGVICRRRRKNDVRGCGQGVCWVCMERRPRSELGMVRTSREEFESLEEGAWWMHERCMDESDLRAYFGGAKELEMARQAADWAEQEAANLAASESAAGGAAGSGSSAKAGTQKEEAPADPKEVERQRIRSLSVKELKAYLDRHGVSHAECVEKSELVARALEACANAAPEVPKGPAWMPVGMVCRLCTKSVAKEFGGVICRRHRTNGTLGGCGEGVCWRCMKRAPRESFGQVRTTKEEFEGLEDEAWWMHEGCFEEGDYKDYFGESEPEAEELKKQDADDDDEEERRCPESP